jgi:transcriptional regulator with XRE-family HTH domain
MNMNDKDFSTEMAEMLPPERVARARKEAEKEILKIRLSELRKKLGIRQKDIKTFSQSSISKLEARKDLKISTLIEYLENLGLGVEIKAYQKNKGRKKNQEYVLLKI